MKSNKIVWTFDCLRNSNWVQFRIPCPSSLSCGFRIIIFLQAVNIAQKPCVVLNMIFFLYCPYKMYLIFEEYCTTTSCFDHDKSKRLSYRHIKHESHGKFRNMIFNIVMQYENSKPFRLQLAVKNEEPDCVFTQPG